MRYATIALIIAVFVQFSCRKNTFTDNPSVQLGFSEDTVFFDTVFTAIGSATQRLKVFNPEKENLRISNIRLEEGNNSQFRINVDGVPGDQEDVVLRGGDSLWIFVEVTVDPNDKSAPFVHEENLLFETNGNEQKVALVAWGQNAYYYRPNLQIQGLPPFSQLLEYTNNRFVGSVVEWDNDKPHVVYGYLRVDSTLTLQINPGTQIHFHQGSGLWVPPGAKLDVRGTESDKVVFQGDRLEDNFDDNPGQWDRIWINEGADCSIQHAIIKNAFVGIQAEVFPFNIPAQVTSSTLSLSYVEIKNCPGIGILGRNYNIDAENILVHNCGTHLLAFIGGGNYSFKHSTFVNYWSGGKRSTPSILASNVYVDYQSTETALPLNKLYFGNCIIDGEQDEELEFAMDSKADSIYLFDHCIVKTEFSDTLPFFNASRTNVEAVNGVRLFANRGDDNFELADDSPAIDFGDPAITSSMQYKTDFTGKARSGLPDAGCYEK